MTTQITVGTETIEPTLVLGYSDAARPAMSLVHEVLGREDDDVTLRPAKLRRGTLTVGFRSATSETDSSTAETLLASSQLFSLVSDERPTLAMTAVVQGEISRQLDDESRDAWILTFGFHEVVE